jgi:conjugative relaxase-like TrwC/TraI family protein
MVTISKPLSAGQAQAYHQSEFTAPEQSYYSGHNQVRGEWQGKLAAEWGLQGEVTEQQFARLANGQHPETGVELIRHRESFEYRNANGESVRTMEHRAGWDATFSAPKSISLTALVGGDERVRDAHRESVRIAVDELERYVQARMGGSHPAETTGKWAAAKFEHDSARPVDGYSAPQLHTHVVFFNVSQSADGATHAIQPRELYKSQQYATSVYRSELAVRLKALGYELDCDRNGAPEVRGYTAEYLEASSPRRQQILEHLENQGLGGAGPAQIAALRTRDAKTALSAEEALDCHLQMASRFDNQAQRVVEEARSHARKPIPIDREKRAGEAVTWARDHNMEREAVVHERDLIRDALRRSMGEATLRDVRANLNTRERSGEFLVERGESRAPGIWLTTREMLHLERDNIERMRAGRENIDAIVSELEIERTPEKLARLTGTQRMVVEQLLTSRDQVTGLQGTAGAGKTTSLAAIREAAEDHGYEAQGLAPTSRAAQQLEEAGISADTLQHHLALGDRARGTGRRRLYFVDESSLASTKQVNEFLKRLGNEERVIFVGDTRQHQGVEAGKPFEQLQGAGMQTAHLDQIIRQKDPLLKEVVEQLARGEVVEAITGLDEQGRVHEFSNPQERMRAIAQDYAQSLVNTLVVSPDNASRMDINRLIHTELQRTGAVSELEHRQTILAPRNDLTGADRQWAARYGVGEVIRYSKGSRALGVGPGEYARVTAIDRDQNLLTVERSDGGGITYDPRRLQGVSVFREDDRRFSSGDRVQFTAPYKDERIANRQLGTVEKLDASGHLKIRLDSGRDVEFSVQEHPHLDYGYAVTSHSGQGATADRVLIHVETDNAHEKLVNSRLAYVAISRGRLDAQIYTNSAADLGSRLSRSISKEAAFADTSHHRIQRSEGDPAPEIDSSREPDRARAWGRAQSRGIGMGR